VVGSAGGTCEHESGREQAPDSRKFSCLLTNVTGHFVISNSLR
jgi:hypothetical protein